MAHGLNYTWCVIAPLAAACPACRALTRLDCSRMHMCAVVRWCGATPSPASPTRRCVGSCGIPAVWLLALSPLAFPFAPCSPLCRNWNQSRCSPCWYAGSRLPISLPVRRMCPLTRSPSPPPPQDCTVTAQRKDSGGKRHTILVKDPVRGVPPFVTIVPLHVSPSCVWGASMCSEFSFTARQNGVARFVAVGG